MIFIKMLSSINKNSRKSKREKTTIKTWWNKSEFYSYCKSKRKITKNKKLFDSEK